MRARYVSYTAQSVYTSVSVSKPRLPSDPKSSSTPVDRASPLKCSGSLRYLYSSLTLFYTLQPPKCSSWVVTLLYAFFQQNQ